VLSSNINLKLSGPDYEAADPLNALVDFNSRISMYEKRYTPIGEGEKFQGYSYCQIVDVGRRTITYNINNVLSSQISEFLQNYHLYPRQIWLTRHGESEDDVHGTLGGNSCLSVEGEKFADALSQFISRRRLRWSTNTVDHSWTDNRNSLSTAFEIWTSQSQKSVQTTQFFGNSYHKRHIQILDELNAGALDGYPRCEIPHRFKDWFEKRQLDKFACRYPGARGEAYGDLIHRLKEIILDVEGSKNHVLFISGLAVIRILLAYFHGLPREDIPHIDVPQGMLYLVDPVSLISKFENSLLMYRCSNPTE
jgi:6-phosphofructo-2-kinase